MQLFEYIDMLNTPYDLHMETIEHSGFAIRSHWHYYTEILYLTVGSIHVNCGKLTHTLHAGELLFIPARTIHSIQTTTSLPSKYVVIKFDLGTLQIPRAYFSTFRMLFTESSENEAYYFPEHSLTPYSVGNLCTNSLNELEKKEFAHDFNVRSNLSMLLVSLARILMSQAQPSEVPTAKSNSNTFFHQILEYIDAHSNEALQVQNLADKCGMSYSYFARLFKETYGRSCKEYIEYIRITKAEEMVLYSDYPMSYIAQETGFADCSHFIRTYKKFRNKTPKQAQLECACQKTP